MIRETVEKMRKQREIKIVICVIPRCVDDDGMIRYVTRGEIKFN